jgi:hypothetical protein
MEHRMKLIVLWSKCFCLHKFICWNLTLQTRVSLGGSFEKWLSHEDRTFITENSAFMN